MMKSLFLVIALSNGLSLFSQHIGDLPGRKPSGEFENVSVEKIADDSLSTAFIIWIRGGIKHHLHETHTESVYVLEGNGVMDSGDKSFNIKAGDYILIPKNTIHSVTAESTMKVLSIQTPQWTTDDRKFLPPARRPHNE